MLTTPSRQRTRRPERQRLDLDVEELKVLHIALVERRNDHRERAVRSDGFGHAGNAAWYRDSVDECEALLARVRSALIALGS